MYIYIYLENMLMFWKVLSSTVGIYGPRDASHSLPETIMFQKFVFSLFANELCHSEV